MISAGLASSVTARASKRASMSTGKRTEVIGVRPRAGETSSAHTRSSSRLPLTVPVYGRMGAWVRVIGHQIAPKSSAIWSRRLATSSQ